ncbi:FtsB family cell division protein [Rathayibacter toxicus]|uniref:Septum formation initiator family protein n=1 Tax=Rathayibacter toxicus TaxID=145458 RepID=A0A2S5Y981_9MICO|nr:septum formation initiator family protein [Rathayibacter toxicus]ALS56817.1 hypothetical protein APU90_02720 [Rathayibacter toxicus]PPG23321.1 septum formation initiator family protein [Rathayibacter toxicus]PPG47905.1 septum formation initiator family protein [Rathayibacter toxicus]PPH25046.1 septum formation initiator family protein [Rathayibacter toxicus]PPH58973.1 septum formation initiator family protein [Rathayibacter toxicus]
MARPPRRPAAPAANPRRPTAASAPRASSQAASTSPSSAGRPSRKPGSTAPLAAASSAWLAGVRDSRFALLMMGIMILAVCVLAPGIRNLVEQRAQIAELQRSLDGAKAQAQNLDEQRARWSDPAFIRAQARERLYFVMPGEVSYLVLTDITLPQQTEKPPSSSVQEAAPDWVGSVLSSLAVSGLGNPAPSELAPAG